MKRPAPPTAWTDVADWYDALVGDEGSEYQQHVVFPGVLRLLSLKPGDAVLDVACGQGVFCRILHHGGVRATGVDAAIDLIHKARQRNAELDVTKTPAPMYFAGDARHLNFVKEADFSAAVCILAIQNIDTFAPVFSGMARALRPGGQAVVVMMHPCFRGPKYSSWGWDEQHQAQYRRVDRYLLPRKEPIFTHPGKKSGQYTWTFHRPISAYVKAMGQAGLLIDAMEEWPGHKTSTSGPRAAAENTARREIPMFLAIRGVKQGA